MSAAAADWSAGRAAPAATRDCLRRNAAGDPDPLAIADRQFCARLMRARQDGRRPRHERRLLRVDGHGPVMATLVLGIAAVSLVLNLWGIDFGLPERWHADGDYRPRRQNGA